MAAGRRCLDLVRSGECLPVKLAGSAGRLGVFVWFNCASPSGDWRKWCAANGLVKQCDFRTVHWSAILVENGAAGINVYVAIPGDPKNADVVFLQDSVDQEPQPHPKRYYGPCSGRGRRQLEAYARQDGPSAESLYPEPVVLRHPDGRSGLTCRSRRLGHRRIQPLLSVRCHCYKEHAANERVFMSGRPTSVRVEIKHRRMGPRENSGAGRRADESRRGKSGRRSWLYCAIVRYDRSSVRLARCSGGAVSAGWGARSSGAGG